GLDHMEELNRHCDFEISPDLVVGDFDSHPKPEDMGCSLPDIIELPCEKDDTDTVFAGKEGIKRGFKDFLIIGGIGGRFDHSLGNAALLLLLYDAGAKAVLSDDFSDMEIVGENPVYVADTYSYFSLLAIYGRAKGIDITDAKYSLSNGDISPDYQYGVSNEVEPGKKACIKVKEGRLLLVKDL
ncbi:MAG: thiamine diphosphokinase, partial [Bacillota bacterium]|nr:thiamine diphosphokinase [Bacillota bacterium]